MGSVVAGSFYLFVVFIITLALVVLGYVLSAKVNYSREKISTYECGFEPMASSRQAFCLRFFILSIIFLVFDVEIALLIPYLLSVGGWISFVSRFLVYAFVVVLLVGLLHEYNEGSLDWIV